jgi:hypothetical protein
LVPASAACTCTGAAIYMDTNEPLFSLFF